MSANDLEFKLATEETEALIPILSILHCHRALAVESQVSNRNGFLFSLAFPFASFNPDLDR